MSKAYNDGRPADNIGKVNHLEEIPTHGRAQSVVAEHFGHGIPNRLGTPFSGGVVREEGGGPFEKAGMKGV